MKWLAPFLYPLRSPRRLLGACRLFFCPANLVGSLLLAAALALQLNVGQSWIQAAAIAVFLTAGLFLLAGFCPWVGYCLKAMQETAQGSSVLPTVGDRRALSREGQRQMALNLIILLLPLAVWAAQWPLLEEASGLPGLNHWLSPDGARHLAWLTLLVGLLLGAAALSNLAVLRLSVQRSLVAALNPGGLARDLCQGGTDYWLCHLVLGVPVGLCVATLVAMNLTLVLMPLALLALLPMTVYLSLLWAGLFGEYHRVHLSQPYLSWGAFLGRLLGLGVSSTLLSGALVALLPLWAWWRDSVQPHPHPPQAVATPAPYAQIDRWALSTPRSEEVDVEHLATYLARGAHGDSEKARAIYRWIAANIAYDAPDFFAKTYPDGDPALTLRTRVAICDGYARLYKALALQAGLQCEYVGGLTRGYEFYDIPDPQRGHAWNAVLLDGHWGLVDSCWAAGCVDEKTGFHRAFNDYFFLTPPQQFVYSHLPTDDKYESLEHPLSREQFHELPLVEPAYFTSGLELITHTNGLVYADAAPLGGRPYQVVVRGPAGLRVGAGIEGVDQGGTLVSRKGQVFTVDISPPAGQSILHLYDGKDSNHMAGALGYRVTALRPPARFPVAYVGYTDTQAELLSPRQGKLDSEDSQHFDLKIPGAAEVFIQGRGTDLHLSRQGDHFVGDARLGAGEATVFARMGASPDCPALLRYQVQ